MIVLRRLDTADLQIAEVLIAHYASKRAQRLSENFFTMDNK